ncbi:MerR family transcriptional regulator [Nocardiopsis rhodophaea]|uniref:MerR family transcriptional regulator n=1 Tax=Nocardiopsis rhodophaea TaxID=280238 RepID=UPI0031D92376
MSVSPPRGMTISQVAERTGLSADTLRYYERIGLIDPVPRSMTGHRVYGEEQLEWLGFVLLLRDTDMSIQEMLLYARLRREGDGTAARRRALLADHRARLAEEIRRLEGTVRYLDQKIGIYDEMLEAERGAGTDSADAQISACPARVSGGARSR